MPGQDLAGWNAAQNVNIGFMNSRPISVILVSLFIAAAGATGLVYHLPELNLHHPFQNEVVWVELVRVVAIVCGVYMLRARNWARLLALAWIAFHVVVSAFHSWQEFVFHAVLFVIFAFVLYRPPARVYFCGRAVK